MRGQRRRERRGERRAERREGGKGGEREGGERAIEDTSCCPLTCYHLGCIVVVEWIVDVAARR